MRLTQSVSERGHVFFWVGIVLFFGLSFISRIGAAEISPDEFLRQYKLAVLEQAKSDKAFHVEGVFTRTFSGTRLEGKAKNAQSGSLKKEALVPTVKGQADSTKTMKSKIDYIRKHDDKIYHVSSLLPEGSDYLERVVIITGEDRGFLLRRQSPNGDYYLENGTSSTSYKRWLTDFEKPVVDAPYSLGLIMLEPVLSSPTFRIHELHETQVDGKNLVAIQFTNTLQSVPTQKIQVHSDFSGTIVVDPGNRYALTSYDVHVEVKRGVNKVSEQLSGHISYKDAASTAIPTPTEIVSTQLVNGAKTEFRFEPTRWALEDFPANTFSLSAYGLGELEKPVVITSNRFSYLAVIVAIIAFVSSVILYRLSRRAAPTTQAS